MDAPPYEEKYDAGMAGPAVQNCTVAELRTDVRMSGNLDATSAEASRQAESHGPKYTTPASASEIISTSPVRGICRPGRGQRVVHASFFATRLQPCESLVHGGVARQHCFQVLQRGPLPAYDTTGPY